LAQETSRQQDSSIARCLRGLEKEGIVKCLFPEKKKGRIYALTKDGGEIIIKLRI